MIRSLFILNDQGCVVIEKHYGGFVNRHIVDQFMDAVAQAGEGEVEPIITTPKFFLANMQENDIFFLAPIQGDMSPLLVLEFLNRVIDTFKVYFNSVTEIGIKNNFVTVYQLLEEMMDSGMPFMTEPNILTEMVKVPSILDVFPQSRTSLPEGALTNVPWRKLGCKYGTNEIFFDIIEHIDTIIDENGMVVNCTVCGEVSVQCKLSGMPDMTLRFVNPRLLDDCSFHPCVRYGRWENERIISFVPPDGAFTLMHYRVYQPIQPPMYCKPQIHFGEGGGRINIMVGTKANQGKAVEDVVVRVPFGESVASCDVVPSVGAVIYDELKKVLVWKIGKIPKERSPQLDGTIQLLPGAPPPECNPIVLVDFRVMMLAATGIKVDSLVLHREHYKPYKGVRCITKAGHFEVRS